MAVVYSTTLKNNRLNLIVNALGQATAPSIPTTGTTNGTLVIGTSSLSGATGVLATVPLATTPASVSGGVFTLLGVPLTATASATGTAALAELRDASGTVVASGLTVGTSGTNVIVSSTAITASQTVQVTAGTINHG